MTGSGDVGALPGGAWGAVRDAGSGIRFSSEVRRGVEPVQWRLTDPVVLPNQASLLGTKADATALDDLSDAYAPARDRWVSPREFRRP